MLPEMAPESDGPHIPREASSQRRLLAATVPISSGTPGRGHAPDKKPRVHSLAESPLLTGFFAFLSLSFLLRSVGVIPGRACHCTTGRMRIQQ